MKNVFKNLMIYGAVASMAFLYSCGGDEETPAPATPTIAVATTVNGTAATSPLNVVPGDEVVFNVSINAEGGFNVYRVFVSKDGGAATKLAEYTRLDLSVDAGVAVVTDSRATEIEAEDVGSTITFEFEVVDDKDQTSTTEVEVVVSSPEANVYTEKLLYAQLANEDSKTFFSTNLGKTVSKNEVDASAEPSSIDIDFGYAVGASGKAWLASPSNYPSFTEYNLGIWNDLNTTNFKKVTLTSEQYMAITTNADLEATYTGSTSTAVDRVEDVVAGSYYALQLDAAKGGKYALINVIAKVDGNSDGDFIDPTDYLEIEVIVEAD